MTESATAAAATSSETPAVPPPTTEAPAPTMLGTEQPKAAAAPAPFDAKAFKAPEGFNLNETSMASFAEVINGDLSPKERGEKLMGLYADTVKSIGEANMAAWQKTNDEWVNEVKADKEIGGDKLDATRAEIAKAIDGLGEKLAPEFRKALDITGAGNHPAVVRALSSWAKALNEGKHVSGAPASQKEAIDLAKTWYPNSPEMK